MYTFRHNPIEDYYYQILEPLKTWLPEEHLRSVTRKTIERFKRRDRIEYILSLKRFWNVLELLTTRREDKKLHRLYWKFVTKYVDLSRPIQVLAGKIYLPEFPLLPRIEERDQLKTVAASTEHHHLQTIIKMHIERLEHLVDTMMTAGYTTAQSIVWGGKINEDKEEHADAPTMTNLILKILQAIDKDREEVSRYIPLEKIEELGGEVLLDCGEGLTWRVLETYEQKRAESRVMDHCGTPSVGNFLLSLRHYDPEKGLKSHLTFEYVGRDPIDDDSAGTLGEMKGYKNQKPSKRYHKQIVQLLLLPQIIAVVGGSYKSENDFSLEDLSPEYYQYLEAHRPELYDPDLIDKKLLFQWVDDIKMPLFDAKHEIKLRGDQIILREFSSTEEAYRWVNHMDLFKHCQGSRFQSSISFNYMIHIITHEVTLDFYSESFSERRLSDFLSNLERDKNKYAKFKTIITEILSEFPPREISFIWRALDQHDFDEIPGELLDALLVAGGSGEMAGLESGTLAAIEKLVEGLFPITTNIGKVTLEGVVATAWGLLVAGTKGGEDNIEVSEEDCRSFRNMSSYVAEVQDFDEEAAIDSFLDHLGDFTTKISPTDEDEDEDEESSS